MDENLYYNPSMVLSTAGYRERTPDGRWYITIMDGSPPLLKGEVVQPLAEEEDEEEDVWPPVWKPVEKSPQYPLIEIYLRLREDDFGYPPGVEDHDVVKKFIRQVRESRGYDVDCITPMRTPFYPLEPMTNLSYLSWAGPDEMSAELKEFVMGKINARAKRHGEMYAYNKLEKVVFVTRRLTYLLTFTVKEVVPTPNVVKTVQAMVFYGDPNGGYKLQELRFKPQQHQVIAPDSPRDSIAQQHQVTAPDAPGDSIAPSIMSSEASALVVTEKISAST